MPNVSAVWEPEHRLTIKSETQTWNAEGGHMDIEVHGSVTEEASWWLQAVPVILSMLKGKVGSDGSMAVRADATPEMIGQWVTERLRADWDRFGV